MYKNINETRTYKRCVSCGLCSSVCPVNAITMIYKNQVGFFRPYIEEANCVNCGKCVKNCPGENVNEKKSLIGGVKKFYLSHSTDTNVRNFSTSGGVINTLIRYILEMNIVDCVLMVGYDKQSPIEASTYIIRKNNVEDLVNNARDYASRYVTVPVLEAIGKISKDAKFAIVGTPCQISALAHCEIKHYRTVFKIGIACSGGMSYIATEEYKRITGMKGSKIFYRGKGWPGTNVLISNDKELEYSHLGSLFERMFSSQIFKNPACRVCNDHFVEDADISFCDYWNGNELKKERIGNSCTIIRTDRAHDIFNDMVQSGYIEIVHELTESDVIESQKMVLKVKKTDLHKKIKYKIFMVLVDYVFRFKIYKLFRLKLYRKFSSLYMRVYRNEKIE